MRSPTRKGTPAPPDERSSKGLLRSRARVATQQTQPHGLESAPPQSRPARGSPPLRAVQPVSEGLRKMIGEGVMLPCSLPIIEGIDAAMVEWSAGSECRWPGMDQESALITLGRGMDSENLSRKPTLTKDAHEQHHQDIRRHPYYVQR